MDINLPPKVRLAIYIIVVMGTAVLVPLNLNGIISDMIMSIWTSVAGAASGLAAFNVSKNSDL